MRWFVWLVVISVASAMFAVFETSWVDATTVRVEGIKRLSAATVTEAAKVPLGTPLPRIPSGEITKRVAELPEVAAVRVDLGWPHTIIIEVTERVPVAYVVVGKKAQYVDAHGNLAGLVPSAAKKPVLITATSSGRKAAAEVVAAIADSLKPSAVTADTSDSVEIVLSYSGHEAKVFFGSSERVEDKLKVAKALLKNGYTQIDVSAPDLPTTIGQPIKK